MQSRIVLALRMLTLVLILAIVAVAVLMVLHFFDTDRAPRTELERAIYAAEDAVRATPDSASARIKLASAYLEGGAVGSAREQADIAVRLAPSDPAAYYILGLVQMEQGDTGEAIDSYTKATSMQGQVAAFYQDAWAALAKAYVEADMPDKALEAIDTSLDFGPENALLLVERAKIYEEREAWADALYDYAQAAQFGFHEAAEDVARLIEDHPEALVEAQERFGLGPDGSFESTTSPH